MSKLDLDKIAHEHCANLLKSEAARRLPPEMAESLVVIAFSLGAAWALDQPEVIEMANAQMDSVRAANKGSIS